MLLKFHLMIRHNSTSLVKNHEASGCRALIDRTNVFLGHFDDRIK